MRKTTYNSVRRTEGKRVEYAGQGVFPAEWGTPPGTTYSEQRAAWVRERVQEHQALTEVRRRAQEVKARAGQAPDQVRVDNVRRQRQLLLARRNAW